MTPPICPHCGFDLALDAPIERDGLRFDPRGAVTWRGAAVHLTRSERIVLFAILKADGTNVSRAVLEERLNYDGLHNPVDVFIHRIRRKLADCPTVTERHLGWRWASLETVEA